MAVVIKRDIYGCPLSSCPSYINCFKKAALEVGLKDLKEVIFELIVLARTTCSLLRNIELWAIVSLEESWENHFETR